MKFKSPASTIAAIKLLTKRSRIVFLAVVFLCITVFPNFLHAQPRQTVADSLQKFILTPQAPKTPRINGPRVFGVRPGSPFLYTIPASGQRPMTFDVQNLPGGLVLDNKTGQITGVLHKKGDYTVTLYAKNALGKAGRKFKIIAGDLIALTPPMGWNSWNVWGISVDDKKTRAAADELVSSGLINYGWNYVVVDGGWTVVPGSNDPLLNGDAYDAQGKINANHKFPDMNRLTKYIHDKGLKFGLHTSPGPITCSPLGFTSLYGHEREGAQRFFDWGVDYIKYDWCSYTHIAKDNSLAELKKPFVLMRKILDSIKRDIVFSINPGLQGRKNQPWTWGKEVGANMWRTTGDITDTWVSMSRIGFSQQYANYAQPGHWNDPDMLLVGYLGWGPEVRYTRLTADEQYTHMSLWSLLSAPLFIGCDLNRLDAFTYSLITNTEVLDVDQDPLGKQASLVSTDGDLLVYSKPLEDGAIAVGLFNKGLKKAKVTARWSDLKISEKQVVHDLWRQKDLGSFADAFSADVAPHGVVLVKIKPVAKR